jgi:hypothetical protein
MAVLTVQQIARSGLSPSYASAAGGGDTVPNDEKTFLHIKNGGGSQITLTIQTPGTVDSLAITDRTVDIPAAGERMIGPFPASYYGATLTLSYSGVTSVTIAAIRMPAR